MARYVIDVSIAIKILESDHPLPEQHEILAPTLLRSEVLDHLFQRVQHHGLTEPKALSLNTRFAKLKFRYLGDAVLRRRAWTIAKDLGLHSTFKAEYIALTLLQADALVTEDTELANLASDLVTVAPFDVLR